MTAVLTPGPLLAELLAAHSLTRAVTEQPQLELYARALIEVARSVGRPVVVPGDVAAERLAGAATVLSTGGLDVWDRQTRLDDRDALVVVVSDVSGHGLRGAVDQARWLGARSVHACGVRVAEHEAVFGMGWYRELHPAGRRRRSA